MSTQREKGSIDQHTRRDFLIQSGAIGGSILASSVPLSNRVYASGHEVIKIGLIGCGGRGAGAVINALSVEPHAKLVAMYDPFLDRIHERRQALQEKAGDQVAVDNDHCFAGFEGYRDLLDSGIDVAILAEPPHFRPLHIEACVEAGVHLLAEKPMAVDAPGVRRVLAAGRKAKKKGLSFVSGFETRYSQEAREAVARLRDGAIGDIVAIQGNFNTGFLWHRGRKPEWTEMQYQLRNWYYFNWLSGDHIVEQHVHFMDKACWFLQEKTPEVAWGFGGREVRTDPKWGDIYDHHAVTFEYDNGVRVYAFCRQQPGCWRDISDLVMGTKGRLTQGPKYGDWRIDGETQWRSKPSRQNPEVNSFKEMFAGVRSGKPVNDSYAMANSTMLAIHGRMATYSGQRVTWQEAFASKLDLSPERYAWDATPPVLPDENGHYPIPIPGVTKAF